MSGRSRKRRMSLDTRAEALLSPKVVCVTTPASPTEYPLTPRAFAAAIATVPRRSRHALRMLIAAWRMVVSIAVLSVLLACAVWHDLVRRVRMPGGGWRQCLRSFRTGCTGPTHVATIEQLCAANGFIAESHTAETKDGYSLQLYRLRPATIAPATSPAAAADDESKTTAAAAKKCAAAAASLGSLGVEGGIPAGSSVLLQHGLFQTCMPFVFNGAEGSLAFTLANAGHDVWLGNNRGNLHSRRHNQHHASDDEFWDFGVDEHAHDVAANINYIKEHNQGRPLAFIGHSQGSAQALIAFSTQPELQSKVTQFIAMSPGAFVANLESRPLRLLANLSNRHPRIFFLMFGRGAFLPFMEVMRVWLGIRPFAYFSFCMFNYLMRWGDDYWDKSRKFLYFSQTPGGTSARTVAQWMQQAASGRFFRYNHGSPELNMQYYNTNEAPDVDLQSLRLPISVIYGGQDLLLNYEKLIATLPNCVFSLNIKHHQHMDNLNAVDAKSTVYPEVLRLLSTRFETGRITSPPTIHR